MSTHVTGFKKALWQWDEYLRVLHMSIRIAVANTRHRTIEEKLKFGPHPNQYIVLHYKHELIGQNKPIVFFLHGGGWSRGNPGIFRFLGHFFVEAGYPVILGGYRHTPSYQFPCQLDDAYSGLKAGLHLASARGLRTDSVILAGQSAGAQLASLMFLDHERLQGYGFQQESFLGLVLISGLLDFAHCQNTRGQTMLRRYLGPRRNWDRADPIQFIRGDETIPVLCIHGERDMLVDKANSISFIEKLNGKGEICLIPNVYHTDLTTMFLDHLPATEVILQWLWKTTINQ